MEAFHEYWRKDELEEEETKQTNRQTKKSCRRRLTRGIRILQNDIFKKNNEFAHHSPNPHDAVFLNICNEEKKLVGDV